MTISGVDPKCYILALFVRDDGTRFLLGDDPYEFKDKQLHFQPNTIANDVVEVQGNDGYLLAGQVRRPGTQSFDGYVGNGTNSKAEVEAKRRDFLQFFRRSHFYKVIYVFPNGTAIQRKQGFLVDDPTVQELYQQYPEYHVALNFEDVNYYTYEEDDEGHEIYAEEAIIRLVGGGATGGLIWDENGVVWESPWGESTTVSGTDFQVDNLLPVRVPISEVELQGDTYQQTYSGKNLFSRGFIVSSQASSLVPYGDNGFTMTKPASRTLNFDFPSDLPAGSYTMSGNIIANTTTLNSTIQVRSASDTLATKSISGTGEFEFKFTATVAIHRLFFFISTNDTDGASITYDKLQVESGSTATSYEPYVGGIPSPNPDYPQPIQVVTGDQTVTVSDGGSNTQTFTIDLGATELCKIGTYQDYIYKSGDDWYVHKEVRHLSLAIAEMNNSSNYPGWTNLSQIKADLGSHNDTLALFTPSQTNISGYIEKNPSIPSGPISINTTGTGVLYFRRAWYGQDMTQEYWQQNYPNLVVELYYGINNQSLDTKITDATLVGQLEALDAMRLFIGENNILVSASSPNLPATLQFDYFTQYLEPHGAEWEEGGTKGPTIVDVNAIDNTYPVWELTGPAINPTLSVLTTNTTLTYNGTITASQTLVIDMFNKTATLNGTSVIGNVSGDWVYMAPGTNRVAYTAGNTDAPDSKISWQEVVG